MSKFSIVEIFAAQQDQKPLVNLSTADERIAKLKKLLAWIFAHKQDLRDALYEDFRKPATETDLTEMFGTTSEIKHTIRHLRSWMRPKAVRPILSQLTNHGYIQYQPKGTVLVISPWNYPFLLAVVPLASAIAAGNTAILKPSEMAMATSGLIKRMVAELFPPEEVTVIEGDKDVAAELLKLPFDHIFFTGSTAVGKIVMRAAAENLSSVTLELGGKSPVIVDESADLEDAAQKIVWGKFVNNGQTCIAPDYIYVHKSIRESFLDKVKKRILTTYGEGADNQMKSPDYARIISDRHFDRLALMLEEALNKGAKTETGGAVEKSNRFIQPTVIGGVPQDSRIAKEEVFGPLLAVHSYENVDEVLQIINNGNKPLAMYIFSSDNANIKYIAQRSTSGSLVINDALIQFSHYRLPFGGVNASGFGNSHGYYGFKAFSHERSVLRNLGISPFKLIYPPYTKRVQKLVDIFLKWL